MFPKLTAEQIERIAAHGVLRSITRGEVLVESGQYDVPFFIVKAGEIEVIRPSALDDLLIAIVRKDQFTGDISMIVPTENSILLKKRKRQAEKQRNWLGSEAAVLAWLVSQIERRI